MAKKTVKKEEDREYLNHTCRECARCEFVTRFNTLTVKDRKPTLGKCPYEEFCVLLSQKACEHFKKRLF